MRDVTDILLTYREATRHLWNTYFIGSVSSLTECGILDKYEEIDRLLFSSLVMEKIGKTLPGKGFNFRLNPIPFLRVVPRKGSKTLVMMISDPIVNLNRKWNEPVELSSVHKAELIFIEFFDWNRYAHVMYPYYLVRINEFPKYPHFEGRDALIEIKKARVLFSKE